MFISRQRPNTTFALALRAKRLLCLRANPIGDCVCKSDLCKPHTQGVGRERRAVGPPGSLDPRINYSSKITSTARRGPALTGPAFAARGLQRVL